MFAKKSTWIIFISITIVLFNRCRNKEANLSLVKNNQSLDSIIQLLPNDIMHVFFVSPSSKCLYCDKKIFSSIIKNDKIAIVSTYDKKEMFLPDNKKIIFLEIPEDLYNNLFTVDFIDLSKYIYLEDKKIKWMQNITPQYLDTIIQHIN